MPNPKARHPTVVELVRLLRVAREQQGISMYALAKRSGLSPQMISYVERGLRSPTLETLLRLTDAMQVDLAGLLGRAARSAARARRP